MLARPSVTLEPYIIGRLPHFKYRLWGLTLHANILGPLAFLLLLIEHQYPSPGRIRRFATMFCACICLVLAQSKTAWLAGICSVALLITFRTLRVDVDNRLIRIIRVFAIAAFFLVSLLVLLLGASDLQGLSADRSLGGGDFSGRTRIWSVALQEWARNPMFGYGPSIWSPEFRASVGMNFAFHAHSQYYQTIGESGAVGLFALACYGIALVVAGYLSIRRGDLFLPCYLLFVILRSVSEPTLRTLNAFSGDVMLHIPLFLAAYFSFSRVKNVGAHTGV
jgi:O-antigen ligase